MAHNNPPPVFWAADEIQHACKYCAALGIVHRRVDKVPQLLNAGIDNGTLTFIEHGGLHYGVTCWHVIQAMRDRNHKCGADTYFCGTLKDGTYGISDAFLRPSVELGSNKQPDIAITRLPSDFPGKFSKTFFRLNPETSNKPAPLLFATAFGYPTEEKEHVFQGEGYRVAMPCAQVTAEAMGGETQFFSALSDAPMVENLSGMSGGPVFWSTADDFGLLGFIYEGSRTGPADDFIQHPRVHFFIDRCDYVEFSRWISELGLRTAPEATVTAVSV